MSVVDFFTFHYVSINTRASMEAFERIQPLHSTMFLLIPSRRNDIGKHICLYIPLCFY